MKLNKFSKMFKFIGLLVNAKIAYNNVKEDPEVAKTTIMFGKRSLVYYFVFLALTAATTGLVYFCVTHFASTLILVAIGAIILAVYIGIYAIGMYILSFNLAIKQVKLNKKPIGIIALVLNIIILAAVLIGLLILFLAIKLS